MSLVTQGLASTSTELSRLQVVHESSFLSKFTGEDEPSSTLAKSLFADAAEGLIRVAHDKIVSYRHHTQLLSAAAGADDKSSGNISSLPSSDRLQLVLLRSILAVQLLRFCESLEELGDQGEQTSTQVGNSGTQVAEGPIPPLLSRKARRLAALREHFKSFIANRVSCLNAFLAAERGNKSQESLAKLLAASTSTSQLMGTQFAFTQSQPSYLVVNDGGNSELTPLGVLYHRLMANIATQGTAGAVAAYVSDELECLLGASVMGAVGALDGATTTSATTAPVPSSFSETEDNAEGGAAYGTARIATSAASTLYLRDNALFTLNIIGSAKEKTIAEVKKLVSTVDKATGQVSLLDPRYTHGKQPTSGVTDQVVDKALALVRGSLALSSIAFAFGFEHLSLLLSQLEQIAYLDIDTLNVGALSSIHSGNQFPHAPHLRLCPTSYNASLIYTRGVGLFSRRRGVIELTDDDEAEDRTLAAGTQVPVGGSQRLTASALQAHTATQPPIDKPRDYGGSESVFSNSAAAEEAAKAKQRKNLAASDDLSMSAIDREDSYRINRVPSQDGSGVTGRTDDEEAPIVLRRESGLANKQIFASPSSPSLAKKKAAASKRPRGSDTTATSVSHTFNKNVGRRHGPVTITARKEAMATAKKGRGSHATSDASNSSADGTSHGPNSSIVRTDGKSGSSRSKSQQQRLRSVQSYANKFRHSDGRSGTTMQEYDDTTAVTLAVPDLCRFAMDTGVQVSVEHVPIPSDQLASELQWQLAAARGQFGTAIAEAEASQEEPESSYQSIVNGLTAKTSPLRLLLLEHYKQTLPFSLEATLDEVAEREMDLDNRVSQVTEEINERVARLPKAMSAEELSKARTLIADRLVSELHTVARRHHRAAHSDPKWELVSGDLHRAAEAVRKSLQIKTKSSQIQPPEGVDSLLTVSQELLAIDAPNHPDIKDLQKKLRSQLLSKEGFDIGGTPSVTHTAAAIQGLADEAILLLSAHYQEATDAASMLLPNTSSAAAAATVNSKETKKRAAERVKAINVHPATTVTLTFAVVSCVACETVLSLPICIPNDAANRHHATMSYALQQHVLHHAASARHRRQASFMGVDDVTRALSIPFTVRPYYTKCNAMHKFGDSSILGQEATGSYTIVQLNGISTLLPVRPPQGTALTSAGDGDHPMAGAGTFQQQIGSHSQDKSADWVVSGPSDAVSHISNFDWRRIVGQPVSTIRHSDTEVDAFTVKMVALFAQLRQAGTLAGQLQRHTDTDNTVTNAILQSLKVSTTTATATTTSRSQEGETDNAEAVDAGQHLLDAAVDAGGASSRPTLLPTVDIVHDEGDDTTNSAFKLPTAVWSPLSACLSSTVNTFAAGGFGGGNAVLQWLLSSLGRNINSSFFVEASRPTTAESPRDFINHFIHAYNNVTSLVMEHTNKLLFGATVTLEGLNAGLGRLRPSVRDSYRQRAVVNMKKVGQEGLFEHMTFVTVVGFQGIAEGLGDDDDEAATPINPFSKQHHYRHTSLLRYRHSCACLTQVVHVLGIIIKELTSMWESVKRRLSMLICQLQVRQAAELGLLPKILQDGAAIDRSHASNTTAPSRGFLRRQHEEKLVLICEISNLMLASTNLMLCSLDSLGTFFRCNSAEVLAKPISVCIPAECSIGKWSAKGPREPAPTVFRLSLQPAARKKSSPPHLHDSSDASEEEGEGVEEEEGDEEAEEEGDTSD